MIALAAPLEARERLDEKRNQWERLARLADELEQPDRDLIRSVIDRGQTIASLARATGVSRRSLNRRFNRLVRRLSDERVRIVLRDRDCWPPLRRRIATDLVVRGLTQRAAAKRHRISLHRLRSELRIIEGLLEADRIAQFPPRPARSRRWRGTGDPNR